MIVCGALVGSAARAQQSDQIRKSIYFGGGSYSIDNGQVEELNQWLDSIPNLDKYQIQLISHTDPIGGRRYNEWLSGKRSEAVLNLLLARDISEGRITIRDWGLENPVYSNGTYRGMEMNRRVDVILFPIVF